MTQDAFALPEWPLAERWVVSYLINGKLHATRHVAGCGLLRRALRVVELEADDRIQIQNTSVLEEPRYLRQVELGNMPAPRDHTCVQGHEAATPSFRTIGGPS